MSAVLTRQMTQIYNQLDVLTNRENSNMPSLAPNIEDLEKPSYAVIVKSLLIT